MIIYGAGGHAKVVMSCILAMNQDVAAIFDDDKSKTNISGKAVNGQYTPSLFPDELLVIAVGDNKLRRLISEKVNHRFGNVIHPSALIDDSVRLDQGSVVFQGSIIQSSVTIGKHVIINTGARIDHDCKIGDFVHIAPGTILCGNVRVGENTIVGAGCIIVPNISIGSNCTIAAGSVVTKSIPDGCIVRGNPGRIIKASNIKASDKIWLSLAEMGNNEQKYVQEAFDGNWIAPAGPNIIAFEKQLAKYTGVEDVAALSSGTAALHLALILLDVKAGDIVLCQSLTFAASANPIVYQAATPVFIDSENMTWNICPNALEEALKHYTSIGKKPKAVVGVHLYGMPCMLDEILTLCEKYEVPFVEDAAEALGSAYRNKQAGSFGKMGIISFNGNKIITTSGGGALLSNDKSLIEKSRFLATQARDNFAHYEHSEIGYNYRMSNVCAGIGRGQMEVIDQRVSQRRNIFNFYHEKLSTYPGISFQQEPEGFFSNRWLTAINIDFKVTGTTPQKIRQHLEGQNMEARPVWKPMHLQPVFKDAKYFGGKVAENLFQNGLCLPSGSGLTSNNLERVCHAIRHKLSY